MDTNLKRKEVVKKHTKIRWRILKTTHGISDRMEKELAMWTMMITKIDMTKEILKESKGKDTTIVVS